jgi:hypothetical protein
MTRAHKLIVAGLTALTALAINTATASALTSYANECPTLGTALCTNGTLLESAGLAIDNSSGPSAGDVWVTDYVLQADGPNKLLEFDASGNLLFEVGESNVPASPWVFGRVAVDPANGDVYMTTLRLGQGSSEPIIKLNSSGVFQLQFTGSETPQGSFSPGGLAVDPTTGDLYVADFAHGVIDKFTSSGTYTGEQFSVPGEPGDIAVDPKGDLYVGQQAGVEGIVREYSSTGAPVDCPGGTNEAFGIPASGVAVDPSDGHIFTLAKSAAGAIYVAEYAAPCTAPIAKFGEGEVGGGAISVNGTTHQVYSDTGESAVIFGLVVVPDVTTGGSPTGIKRASAQLNGTVNPDETEVTACEFEYGSTQAYGLSVPCEQTLPLEGNRPVAVTAEIRGVQEPPSSQVFYRLKASNSQGHNFGERESFYLESFPAPVVGGVPASSVSQFAATLNATLQTGEALVNYHFEYGTSAAYGQVEPIPDEIAPITGETVPVSQPVNGLQAGTTYHYRLVASSPGGTEVKGPDGTFTTLPVPAPSVETGGASGVGVGAATLGGTIDPHGWDTSYSFEYGTSAAYGSSWPTVEVELGALEGPQPVIVNLPNLLPSTTYHYRLVATNGGGTSDGPDMTFTTGEYPAQVIQEPVALRTLLVPTLSETTKPSSKKGKKPKKKRRKGKAGHRAKSGRGHKRKSGKK